MNSVIASSEAQPFEFPVSESQRLEDCLAMLKSCLSAVSNLQCSPAYAEVFLRVSERARIAAVFRWLETQGAQGILEVSPEILSCVVEDTPQMRAELQAHPSIAVAHKIRSLSLIPSSTETDALHALAA